MALSGDKQRPVQSPAGGITTAALKLAGYTNRGSGSTAFTTYKGAIVACDVSDTDGYFGPMDFTGASGDVFGGVALEKQAITSSDTGDGSKEITVARDGIWGFAKGSIAITDIGAIAYASDDDTVTTSSSNAVAIGRIVDVDDTYVWVDISKYWMVPTS
jgi:hypothetical protein